MDIPLPQNKTFVENYLDTGKSVNALHESKLRQKQQELANYYKPLDEARATYEQQRLGNRFNQAHEALNFINAMPPATKATWIADHQDEYNQLVGMIGNKAYLEQLNENPFMSSYAERFFPGISGKQEQNSFNPMNQQIPTSTEGMINQQEFNQNRSGSVQSLPNQQDNSGFFKNQPETNDRMKLASQMTVNKELSTSEAQQQAEASKNFINFYEKNRPEYSKKLSNISQYAGYIGGGKKMLDKLKSEKPEAYQDYLWFKDQLNPTTGNLQTQLESLSVQKGQRDELRSMLGEAYDTIDSDPKTSVKLVNSFFQMLNGIAQERLETAQPIFRDTYKKAYGTTGIEAPYVKPAVKSFVQSELKGEGTPVNLYNFKDKEDFNNWFKGLDRETQQSVLKKLKSQKKGK